MKIAIIGHKRIPSNEGGIEKGVEEHGIRMVQKGHYVVAYNRGGHNVFGADYDTLKRSNYRGIRIITIPTVKGAMGVPLYSLLATLHAIISRYDVISYRASGPCAMIPLAKLFGLRCVASLHGFDSQREKWGWFASKYLELGEKMAATKADVCLVLSENMKLEIKKRYGKDAVVFANGISEPKCMAPKIINEKYGLEKDSYILFLGRIVPEKGLHFLIRAFRKCETAKKLVVAGGVEENKSYYRKLLDLAENDKRIVFTGFVMGDEVCELYSNAYLFVLPSNLEGMANALLEAMSYGNCCLVSDIPENLEVVGSNAVCFPKGNESALSECLTELITYTEIVDKYKKKASEYILNRYNWDTVVEQLLEIYAGNIVSYEEVREKRGIAR